MCKLDGFERYNSNSELMSITNERLTLARKVWLHASEEFGFPVLTSLPNEIEAEPDLLLVIPPYGQFTGIVVGLTQAPQFETNSAIINWASRKDVAYSFINVADCLSYDPEIIRETLEDWGVPYLKSKNKCNDLRHLA